MRRGLFAVLLVFSMALAGCLGPSTASWGTDENQLHVEYTEEDSYIQDITVTSGLGSEKITLDSEIGETIGCGISDMNSESSSMELSASHSVPISFSGYLAASHFYSSHSPTGGAFGSYMFGIGATEMAGVLATGEIWLKVPETIYIKWKGKLNNLVTAKDMMLSTCRQIGMGGGQHQTIQYSGEAIYCLSVHDRMT